ncbi:hypothetical protein HPP92_021103 [Vanilla planifolia]|uniref:Uncharacterized protein n=1 Tax=Vanilla planifolia TaxID=51239 RepID=A0A835Q7B5_VANPL|nr:hypothetical protein HPP92_021103 [Vanilla planifolia]
MEAAKDMKKWHIPAFGNWEYCDEMPITQYFESARQAGLCRASFGNGGEDDLLKVPVAMPLKSGHHCRKQGRKKSRRRAEERQQTKQGIISKEVVGQPGRPNTFAPRAVDEDLYKIPPEFLRQKPKKKTLLRKLFSGCLCINCFVT